MDKSALINLLFSGGTALAGLILIFLGGILNSFESYDRANRDTVVPIYRPRVRLSFAGFLSSILSALTALAWHWGNSNVLVTLSLIAFLVSCFFLIVVAVLAVKEV